MSRRIRPVSANAKSRAGADIGSFPKNRCAGFLRARKTYRCGLSYQEAMRRSKGHCWTLHKGGNQCSEAGQRIRSPIICASWDAVNNKSIGTCLEGSSRQRSCDYARDRMTGGFGRAEFEALILEDDTRRALRQALLATANCTDDPAQRHACVLRAPLAKEAPLMHLQCAAGPLEPPQTHPKECSSMARAPVSKFGNRFP